MFSYHWIKEGLHSGSAELISQISRGVLFQLYRRFAYWWKLHYVYRKEALKTLWKWQSPESIWTPFKITCISEWLQIPSTERCAKAGLSTCWGCIWPNGYTMPASHNIISVGGFKPKDEIKVELKPKPLILRLPWRLIHKCRQKVQPET